MHLPGLLHARHHASLPHHRLTQVYEHACELLGKFGEIEVTVSFLVEVDKLIQLLESPIFTYLRLQLLEPQRYAYLVKVRYWVEPHWHRLPLQTPPP